MQTPRTPGIFVVVKGPNGVGKSTIVSILADYLGTPERDVLTTKEPSNSRIGSLASTYHSEISGVALACLIAADRYEHLDHVVKPALAKGRLVLTDRCVLSSLVYQGTDGVTPEFIWSLSSYCIVPDLTVCLMARPEILAERLSTRNRLTRFARSITPAQECHLYKEGCLALLRRRWGLQVLCNENGPSNQIAKRISEEITYRLRRQE